MKKLIVAVIIIAAFVGAGVIWAKDKDKADKDKEKDKPAPAAVEKAADQVIELSVTKAGFVPAQIKVKVGRPVKLMVTRKIEQTCAKDIVIKDYGIQQPLPLNQTVEVAFTPIKAGSSRFACAMDMIAGTIVAD
jgi:plastocyanin domain-containing protein